MIDDLVVRIGGDRVDCSVLILGEIDPHSYELVKGDDEKIERAHIVFFNGLNLEHGASLQSKLLKHPHAVSLGDFILKHCSGKVLFEEGQPDPHIWMDISLWAFAITPIVDSLAAIDPEGKTYYETRAAALKQELLISHETLLKKMGEIPEEIRYLVTSHDAFGYFTRAYLASEEERELGTWKKRFAAPEGLSPDGQIGVVDLQRIIDYLEQHHVRVVFPESNVSQDSLRKIVFACQAKNRSVRFSKEPLYGDSMGPKDSSSGHYVGMIEHNGDVLIKEWTK
jgi:manganese/zinc/iron transport system substrate-binding protein